MRLSSLSHRLEQATQPNHPYYHPIQVTLFASLSYLGTACLTSIPPTRGMTVTILAYGISQLTAPLFSKFFEPYREVTLAPFIGQVLQISLSLLLSKIICRLARQSLSFKEIRQIGIVFLISLYVSRFALLKFRQQRQRI